MSLTRELSTLIRNRTIADTDREAAALYVLDTVASALAGRNSVQGRILLRWAEEQGNDSGRAAFLLGALGHILEIDDLHRDSITHPGCVVVPAAWAVARRNGTRGRAFLDAVLHGYEAVCRIGRAVGAEHYKVWHNTATCGPFGAAMAVSALLDLDTDRTVWALGNAGTQASGLWQFLYENAMSKHLHAGRASESGLIAAQLADKGFTGPAHILEGDKGLFRAACPDAAPDRVLADPEAPWQLTLTSIKPWPSCRHTHPAIDAALSLHRPGESRQAADIADITVSTYQAALDLCDKPEPQSEYEAKFSLQHCVAAALVDGVLTLGSFDDSARNRLRALTRRVGVERSDDYEKAYPAHWGAAVHFEAGNGEKRKAERNACKGDPELPVSGTEVREKALMLMHYANLSGDQAGQFAEAILSLPGNGELPALPGFDD